MLSDQNKIFNHSIVFSSFRKFLFLTIDKSFSRYLIKNLSDMIEPFYETCTCNYIKYPGILSCARKKNIRHTEPNLTSLLPPSRAMNRILRKTRSFGWKICEIIDEINKILLDNLRFCDDRRDFKNCR